jgi:2C-methyl-D-erythritol 2,4-cyclodiphosphate synthase
MNNDLEQFSEERLKELSNINGDINTRFCDADIEALARIALAAKQAKPVGFVGKSYAMTYFMPPQDSGVEIDDLIYTTPRPAHTEPEITDNVRDALEKAMNAMQFMGDTLNNLDAVCAEDVEHVTPAIEAIRKLLAAAPKPESE